MTNFLEQAIFEHMGDDVGEDEAAATAEESASASTMSQLTGISQLTGDGDGSLTPLDRRAREK
jgi:hypothetical protein